MPESQNPSPTLTISILRARFLGIPFGAALISLPTSFALGTLAFDILCRCHVWTEGAVTARGGYYTLLAALFLFIPAIPPLLVELFLIRRGSFARVLAILYMVLIGLAIAALFASFWLRSDPAVLPDRRLGLSALTLCVVGNSFLLLAAHLRGRLTYTYRLSVVERPAASGEST